MRTNHCRILLTLLFGLILAVDGHAAEPGDLWTADQKATIRSIRPVEGSAGCLFEMDYTADYMLDDCIAAVDGDIGKMASGIYEVILPQSKNPFTNINTQGAGCSCISAASSEGGYILGRNYDYPVAANRFIVLHTHPENGYRSVGMFDISSLIIDKSFKESPFECDVNCEAALLAPYAIFDGMNEKGLMCSFMQLEYEETHQHTGRPKLLSNWILRLILDRCATVDEALKLIAQYDIQSVFTGYNQDLHFIIADGTGERVIVEFVADEMKVLHACDIFGKDVPYVASTNFYLTPERRHCPLVGLFKGEIGYWRFKILAGDLAENSTPSRSEAMKFMEHVHIMFNDREEKANILLHFKNPRKAESWSWMSLWSTVYNNATGTVDVCVRENYSKTFRFGVDYLTENEFKDANLNH